MRFTSHAAPPPGVWTNDPNGLIFAGGRYHLFAQASTDAPAFKAIGWGSWSSDDLLHWEWDGFAIPPMGDVSAYSGSVTRAAPFEAFITRHDPSGPMQTQWRAAGDPPVLDPAPLGPAGRNMRDPFVFAWGSAWRMLLAQPCDWTDWADDPPSTIAVWASDDKSTWTRVGTLGPWAPRGVMWEVPLLLDFGDVQALLISTVDRRGGGALSGVSYWLGSFDGATFAPADGPHALDFGPDFYAACVNTVDNWPGSDRVLVGWASSWATARTMRWPAGVHGGPITLPRVLTLEGAQLVQRPIAGAKPRSLHVWDGVTSLSITVPGPTMAVSVDWSRDRCLVARTADDARFAWAAEHAITPDAPQTITVFVDAGLVEMFCAPLGVVVTAFVG